jgi:septation ring formation regulator EzrA
MPEALKETIEVIDEKICSVTHNFNRAVDLSSRLSLNVDEIESMDMSLSALIMHLKTIEAAIKEARQNAEQMERQINEAYTEA